MGTRSGYLGPCHSTQRGSVSPYPIHSYRKEKNVRSSQTIQKFRISDHTRDRKRSPQAKQLSKQRRAERKLKRGAQS